MPTWKYCFSSLSKDVILRQASKDILAKNLIFIKSTLKYGILHEKGFVSKVQDDLVNIKKQIVCHSERYFE